MNPIRGNYKFRMPCSIVDGCMAPELHMSHMVVEVLEHIPKCCPCDYLHSSRVLCSCGEKCVVSDQFIDWHSNPDQWKGYSI